MTAENPPASYQVAIKVGALTYAIDSDDSYDDTDAEQVLDGLSIGWGFPSGAPWPSQPDPSYCTLRLLALDVATLKAAATEGTPVSVECTDGTGFKFASFYGRIATATATPVRRKSGPRTLFTLSCVDYLVDLAETTITLGARPAESIGSRLFAIQDAIMAEGGGPIGSIPVGGGELEAASAKTGDALAMLTDVLRQHSTSSGFRRYYVYPAAGGTPPSTLSFNIETYTDQINSVELPGLLTQGAQPNLMTNPSVEVDLAGFGGATGATFARVLTDHHGAGVASLELETTGPGAGFVFWGSVLGQGAPVTPGDYYTATCWAKNVNYDGVAAQLYVTWYDAAGAPIFPQIAAGVAPTIAAGWTQMSVSGIAPPGAAWMSLAPLCTGGIAGVVQRFDEFTITRGGHLDISWPSAIGGDSTKGIISGDRVPFESVSWRNAKKRSVTRVTVAGPFGTVTAAQDTTRVVKLELSTNLTGADIPLVGDRLNSAVGRMAKMYLPAPAESEAWEAVGFRFMASGLERQLAELMPNHASGAVFSQWPIRPVVVTEVPDDINLDGPSGVYLGQLNSAEVSIERNRVYFSFTLRRSLPTPLGNQAKTASYDYVEATFPGMDYDHVAPSLTYDTTQLARKA